MQTSKGKPLTLYWAYKNDFTGCGLHSGCIIIIIIIIIILQDVNKN